jgi:O-methyltransferase involved in polyketide biosynthesis
MKIQLHHEMETLIIPLYGKAQMSEAGIFKDPFAEAAIRQLDYDCAKLTIQKKTQVMLAIRAVIIDRLTSDFVAHNPASMVLHLGCGLDARYLRLGLDVEHWYDLDFPEVIEIKKTLYHETANYQFIASSVTSLDWLDRIQSNQQPILVIAEGLLMYLDENEILALLEAMKVKFGGYTIIFDAYSKLTAKSARNHPSLRKTGATIRWGLDAPEEMEGKLQGAKQLKTIYLTNKEVIKNLPKTDRFLFKFAGLFKIAREAHRVLVMRVSDTTNLN